MEYVAVVLFCFVCFEWMLCCDVVCEKKKIKNVDNKKTIQIVSKQLYNIKIGK